MTKFTKRVITLVSNFTLNALTRFFHSTLGFSNQTDINRT